MQYFKFYSNIILVPGFNRSLLVDIQMRKNYLISNSICNFVKRNEIDLTELRDSTPEMMEVITKWLDYFIANNLGHYTNNPELFPEMSTEFFAPGHITNMVIEASAKNIENIYDRILPNINKLGVKAMVFLFTDAPFAFNRIAHFIENSCLEHVEFYFPHDLSGEVDLDVISLQKKVRKITFCGSGIQQDHYFKNDLLVDFLPNTTDLVKSCGNIYIDDALVNKNVVLESLNHNSCLHKKISIDKDGNIKNCPAMPESFGNIENTALQNAIAAPDFKKYWDVTKDKIEICKDCEFRHVCNDCRAYVENPDNMYSKPLKCGYSPYTNVWEEWSTNPLKQKAIKFYNMQDLVKEDV